MGQHFGVHKFWGPRILIHPQKMDSESVMPATIVVVLIVATKDVDAGVFGLAVPRNQVVCHISWEEIKMGWGLPVKLQI